MVSRNLSGYSQISFEELVSQNPEFIFTDEWGYDQITSENALQSVNAIKNNQVYILKNGSLSVASHNIVLAIEELTNIIYK
jgi:ABC-type Fe3+-hydroxamate transport system substrate-binding protein